jgi:hypothetical protein
MIVALGSGDGQRVDGWRIQDRMKWLTRVQGFKEVKRPLMMSRESSDSALFRNI